MLKVIKHCKYLLPCGHCDKFDAPCSQYDSFKLSETTLTTLTNQINHEHKWVCNGMSTIGAHYVCTICGITKTEQI